MKRTPLKRKTRLNPISKSKHRRQARFMPKEVIQEVLDRSQYQCEAQDFIPAGTNVHRVRCGNRAEEIHHILPRSRGGKHTPDNLLHLCKRPHHDCCKANPVYARSIGILK